MNVKERCREASQQDEVAEGIMPEWEINPDWVALEGKPHFVVVDLQTMKPVHLGPPPEGWVDTDEGDGLPEDQDEKHFATDEGSAQEYHDDERD
jgi:hypothetical protein